MATTRIIPLHAGKGRTVGKAISDIIDYVKNPEKTDHSRLITSYQCDSRVADAQFLLDKQTYAARTGRVRGADDVIAYHLRQSFVPGEITPEEANRLGVELARRFTKGKHAFVVCTHIDKSHTHNHIIWNSTTLECDRKFRNFWGSTRAVHRLSDTICIENGYSIVEAPKRRGQSYNKWLGDAAKPSHKELLRQAIDRALAQKPTSLEELLRLLEQDGFTVHRRGKTISISAEGWGNNVRFDRLGDGYTLDDLLAVLSGQKEHTTRKQAVPQAAPPRVNLLVDIQAKLQAGKGAGYARWAKVFNLKQMAQTLNYLSEHELLDYADLEAKTAEATARYHALSDQIKAAEKRMAEIAVLRTHIVNYAKTRDTYVAYRKAGYSRKFRQEHKDGKQPAFRGKKQKRFIRLRSLGEGYSEEELRAVISGKSLHKSKGGFREAPEQKQFHLLIDIQSKMAEGKSVGYEKWAKKYNRKEAARTVCLLKEKGVDSYEDLIALTNKLTTRFSELSDSIKAAEKRMVEIGALQTHINNYSKTRKTYEAYRKSGYSKKFFEEHRDELMLHKAAKQAFDQLDGKKVPSRKALHEEFNQLLVEKKQAYAEYRQVKKDMQEYLIAKQTVETILNIDKKKEQEKEQKKPLR